MTYNVFSGTLNPTQSISTWIVVYVQLFRKDLISAMKLPDTEVLQYDEYFLIGDTWKLEWERGVQVPVDPDAIPPLVVQSVSFSSHGFSVTSMLVR